jgi:sulfur carrier protein
MIGPALSAIRQWSSDSCGDRIGSLTARSLSVPLFAMKIVINGQDRDVPSGATVAQLIDELGIEARHVAVEVNLELVPRAQHPTHQLQAGDQLEVVTLVGGG